MSSNESTQEAEFRQHILISTPCDATSILITLELLPQKPLFLANNLLLSSISVFIF